MTINLIDARRGLHNKCLELFADKNIAEKIYRYLCDGIEDCEETEPIKHGHWIDEGLVDGNQNRYCRCSECGKSDTQAISQRVPYCWWCGARMDGGENDDR